MHQSLGELDTFMEKEASDLASRPMKKESSPIQVAPPVLKRRRVQSWFHCESLRSDPEIARALGFHKAKLPTKKRPADLGE
mmetsp:Transcript_2351/g.3358  ORF Transcript_2351/g.3358 Transcript_2351/m.3358 type:complete len:81 (-) Transcript_2351:22-264(-)